ncbi:radical SAM protein [Anaerococcus nagyae]|uniref:radical SAM/SPASM domain-containing protein n=1 Tax=Anaerococcus nagyae TaxID=1755241 RepID=UPI0032517912
MTNNINYILRPEFYGGLLINRDNFDKWNLNRDDMLYLWFYYHCKNHNLSLDYMKLLLKYEPVIDKNTIDFSKSNNYLIAKRFISSGNLIDDAENLIKHMENRKTLSAPMELTLYLNDFCQLDCKFCFMKGKINSKYEMPLEKVKYLIDEFVDNGVETVSLLGGEPFLHTHIIDILKYLEGKGIHYTVTTNGININKDLLECIKDLKNIGIVFSIYSLNDSNKLMMGIHHNKITEKIILAKKYDIKTSINTVLVNQNVNDIKKVVDFCNNYDIDRYSLAIFSGENRDLDPMSMEKALDLYFNIKNDKETVKELDFAIEGCMIYSAIYSEEDYYMDTYTKLYSGCQAAQSNIEIMPDGRALACVLIDDVFVDNVFDKTFKEIWDSKEYDIIRDYKVDNYICNNCNYLGFCNGGCFLNKNKTINGYEKDIDSKCSRLKNVKISI